MTRRKSRNAAGNSFLIWNDFMLKTSEMLFASVQVIGHRTGRIATAGALPSARDCKEFTLMGQEKIEAAAESAQAMAIRIMSINQQLGIMVFKQAVNGASNIISLATLQATVPCGMRQAEMVGDALAQSTAVAAHLSGSMARLAQHGLKPIHARATGNAKRLAKIRI